jgi:PTS system nitrogen regulatory IIA component
MNSPSGFSSIVSDASILLGLKVASKDALMVALANAAAEETGVPATMIVERVREREALGSTGFGLGAAIPHARIAGLSAVTAVVARLAQAVDYGALDREPVDVAVLLLSPEGAGADHLKALARISRALRDPASLARLRGASDLGEMRDAIAGHGTGDSGKQAA